MANVAQLIQGTVVAITTPLVKPVCVSGAAALVAMSPLTGGLSAVAATGLGALCIAGADAAVVGIIDQFFGLLLPDMIPRLLEETYTGSYGAVPDETLVRDMQDVVEAENIWSAREIAAVALRSQFSPATRDAEKAAEIARLAAQEAVARAEAARLQREVEERRRQEKIGRIAMLEKARLQFRTIQVRSYSDEQVLAQIQILEAAGKYRNVDRILLMNEASRRGIAPISAGTIIAVTVVSSLGLYLYRRRS